MGFKICQEPQKLKKTADEKSFFTIFPSIGVSRCSTVLAMEKRCDVAQLEEESRQGCRGADQIEMPCALPKSEWRVVHGLYSDLEILVNGQ